MMTNSWFKLHICMEINMSRHICAMGLWALVTVGLYLGPSVPPIATKISHVVELVKNIDLS